MLYIVIESYTPNTAATNRYYGFIKAISKLGQSATVVFQHPDSKESRVTETIPNIHFEYLWDKYKIPNNRITSILTKSLIPRLYSRNFHKGDTVLCFSTLEFLHATLKRRDVKVFHERTEHPDAVGYRNPLTAFPYSKYYKDCQKLDGLFVISTCLKKFFVTKGIEEEKVHIINMTVDASRFDGLVKAECEPYLAYCGVIYNNKDGVDQLIKAFAKVTPQYPNLKLYIIGPTPNGTEKAENMELAKNLGVSDNVVLCGSVSAVDMPQLLKNAKMCVLDRPDSLRSKAGFATKLGEYLLSENPAVITKVGDFPLFLKDKESVIFSSPDNPDDFAQQICWVLEHEEDAIAIGKRGAEVAKQYFNSEVEAEKIIKIIRS